MKSDPTRNLHESAALCARNMASFPGRPAQCVSQARAAVRGCQETDWYRVFKRDDSGDELQVQLAILLYRIIQVLKTHFIGRVAAEEFLESLFMAAPAVQSFFVSAFHGAEAPSLLLGGDYYF